MINRVLYPRSAVENVMLRLGHTLEEKGHEVSYFVRENENNLLLEHSYAAPMRSPGEENRFKAMWRAVNDSDVLFCLDQLIEAINPDMAVVFSVNRTLTYATLDVLKHWGIPTYVTMLDYSLLCPARTFTRDDLECKSCLKGNYLPCILHRCLDDNRKRSALGAFEAFYLRRTHRHDIPARYLVPSEYHRDLLHQANLTTRGVEVVDLPLPEEAFAIQERKKRGDYFLYVGTLSERKGLPTLLRAMRQTINCPPLMIAGNGRDTEALRQLCEELGIAGRVQFIGQVPGKQIRQLMAQCLCLVAPSSCEEIGPWALLEAQAMGKPAIVSDFGVLPQRVQAGKTGLVFHADDVVELAQCMDEMVEMEDAPYQAMCRAARSAAKKRYHPDVFAEKILKIHDQVMKELAEEAAAQ